MTQAVDVLIVGAGPAGAACAGELRERGFGGSILLVGRELDAPYSRPDVSKSYLRGDTSRDEALLRPDGEWQDRGIDLLTRTSVMKLDPGRRVARLSDKRDVSFRHALLATGANVRRLRLDGLQLDGIHHLRALSNADALRADVESREHVVLVGGSFIACEVAASLTEMGKRCTLVMPEEAPLSREFGADAGRHFGRFLRERGIDQVCGDAAQRLEPAAAADAGGERRARVGAVVTESGRVLPADVVVMGTGSVPDIMLARSAGLELGDTGGIRCSSDLETSAAGIWAAGDVCEYESPIHGRRVRIEHWEVARAQGRAVAAAMLGDPRPFDEVPYFWSDLSDWCKLEFVGWRDDADREVVRGSFEDGRFTVLYLDGRRLTGALSVGREDDLLHAARLLYRGDDLGDRVDQLADPRTSLGSF